MASFLNGQWSGAWTKRQRSAIRRRTFFPLLAIAGMEPLITQDKLPPVFLFNHLTMTDGLPSNGIRSNGVGDCPGFIWKTTVRELARSDGYSYKVYRHVPCDPHSISSDENFAPRSRPSMTVVNSCH